MKGTILRVPKRTLERFAKIQRLWIAHLVDVIKNLHGHALKRVTGTFPLLGVYAVGFDPDHGKIKMVGTLATATIVEIDNVTFLERVNKLMEVMHSVAERTDLNVVGVAQHQFEPKGATGVLLLSESHFCVHTW